MLHTGAMPLFSTQCHQRTGITNCCILAPRSTGTAPRYPRHVPAAAAKRLQRLQRVVVRASSNDSHSDAEAFNLAEYYEAKLENVRHTDKYGHVLFLKLLDGNNSVLPVYIGDFECAALVKEINKRQSVTKVRVNALVGNTYHARVHYMRAPGSGGVCEEVDIDARPSDAINLAVRFAAPIYVNKEVATKMAGSVTSYTDSGHAESSSDVVRTCREELLAYQDPTILFKLQMQVAAAEERYDDAAELRNRIERILASDRCLGLVVAIESALDDGRYEEAARLRDELRDVRRALADAGDLGPVRQVQDL